MRKWSKKLAIEHLQELKNPFEEVKGNGNLPNLANKIRDIAIKNKGVEPE